MTTFAEILDDQQIPYIEEKAGWINMECPWCGGNPYLGYNTFGNYLNCWRDGPKSLVEYFNEVTDLGWGACQDLAKSIISDMPTEVFKPKGKLQLPPMLEDNLWPAHEKYLTKERGFDTDELKQLWKIQCVGPATALRWRVFIPIHYKGKVVSWTTRSVLKDAKLRYVTAHKARGAARQRSPLR
jgi:hypothetical protein